VNDWKDMATAPKDGSKFIALTKDGRAVTAQYRESVDTWKKNRHDAWVPDRVRKYYAEIGSHTIAERDFTHWDWLVLPADEAGASSRREKMLDLSQLSGGPQ
jgi:hypothetical protein